MSHLDDVIQQVSATLDRHIISEMNILLIALSNDTQLSREERYTQQQRLRTAIAQKGSGSHHSPKEQEDNRRESLTRGGEII